MTNDDWQPFSVRQGRAEPEGPFEGVPDHLLQEVKDWIDSTINTPLPFGNPSWGDDLARRVALKLHIAGDSRYSRTDWLLQAVDRDGDGEKTLDVVDRVLYETAGRTADDIREVLTLGGSALTVNDRGTGLQRRVPAAEQAAYESATSPADTASDHLQEAWANLYGRHPDPSDAWDHAIKACEAVLCPIGLPKEPTATLGKVIANIGQAPAKWTVRLPGKAGGASPVEALRGLLEMVWTGQPDRHASGPSYRAPTQEEAADAVHIAVLVVNLVRRGGFARAATSPAQREKT